MDAVGVDARGDASLRIQQSQAERFCQLPKLPQHVLPLAHAQVVEELGLAQTAKGAGTELFLLLLEVVPEVQQREEVARRVGKARVLSVGLLAAFERAFTRVLNGESGDDRHDLAARALRLRLDHHPAEARIDRKLRQLLSDSGESGTSASAGIRRQLAGRAGRDLLRTALRAGLCAPSRLWLDRAQLGQKIEAVFDIARIGRGEEGKRRDVAESERNHLQNHGGEVRAQNFRLGVLGSACEVLL